jgi:SAP domain-containing protein
MRGRSFLKSKSKLSKSMTPDEFDNGYWYATELKKFAEAVGIPGASKLRKDELEKAIKTLLTTGEIKSPTRRALSFSGTRDVERGLNLRLPVRVYTNDRETKDFLEREAQRMAPGLKRKSGARYRLNRWREEQITKGLKITYADLVKEYVRLNRSEEPFKRIPHGRYINFMSDFLASERGATREQAIEAWEELKALDTPKDYRSWAKACSSRSKR